MGWAAGIEGVCVRVRAVSHSGSMCVIQWNLSIKGTLNMGHFSNENTVCSPHYIELCTNLPLN